jgi:peptidoglycan/xylan/chitin deacetylase (PgdA/CDA1 family)
MNGTFMISLDFELHWGGFEKWPVKDYRQYFLNTRSVIPQMLALFEKYEVHVTWATVGILFHKTKQEFFDNLPQEKPTYHLNHLSAFDYIERNPIGNDEDADPLHFAPSLVRAITETKFQELGSHTFAHYYCNEEGQTITQFRADLRAAQRAAIPYNRKLTSLVFPRNQFNDQYLKICFEEGITAVRSNPLDWFWNIGSTEHESAWKRLNRGLDAYFPIGGKTSFPAKQIVVRDGFPLCIPASRLLRPYRPKEFFLNKLKLKRIRREMHDAAARKEVYHLWWHPHNFGHYPRQSMLALEEILKDYAYCHDKFGMNSLSMGEFSSLIRHEK